MNRKRSATRKAKKRTDSKRWKSCLEYRFHEKSIHLKNTLICFFAEHSLKQPSWMFSLKLYSKSGAVMILSLILWGILGGGLNACWAFPNFCFYAFAFYFILAIAYSALKYFYASMEKLNAETIGFDPMVKSQYFYLRTESSFWYVIFPLFFILAYGVGGISMYRAISVTPTFIWLMIFFTADVFFSMLAYLQYIRFAVYLHQTAHNELSFRSMISPDNSDLPPNLSWLVRIANISQALDLMFFMLGALYIFAFAFFCFSPAYQAKINDFFFYVLWTLIFIFIVLVFPVVSIHKTTAIKKIVIKAKNCYIHELLFEEHLQNAHISGNDKLLTIVRNYCISIILNAPDYPTSGKLNAVFSCVGVIINFSASVATILQYQGIQLFYP